MGILLHNIPAKVQLLDFTAKELESIASILQYQDKKIDFQIRNLKKYKRYYSTSDQLSNLQEKLDVLKAERIKTLLYQTDTEYWIPSGVRDYVQSHLKCEKRINIEYPISAAIPWDHLPPLLRQYQEEAKQLLLKAKHGAIELATGTGKSLIIAYLLKELALKSVVMAPSVSIANQLYESFVHYFGSKYVGKYGDGKKEYKKLFTVAIAASLSRLTPLDDAWQAFNKSSVFCADECFLTPATTMANICFGLMGNAPYRFFVSGTHMRNDGLDLLLDGITGPVVYRMTVKEGVDKGFLAKPIFKIIHCESEGHTKSDDANTMTRAHLFYNDAVNKTAADIANRCVGLMNRQVLILIEELEQFSKLLPHLKHKVAFAHGGVTKDNAAKVPEAYHDSNPGELVSLFNAGKLPILVGTSCISTGTDIRSVQALIYLKGGKSEIEVKQSIGRSTRLVDGKKDCIIIDFDVENIDILHRHTKDRREIYNDIYGPVQEIML